MLLSALHDPCCLALYLNCFALIHINDVIFSAMNLECYKLLTHHNPPRRCACACNYSTANPSVSFPASAFIYSLGWFQLPTRAGDLSATLPAHLCLQASLMCGNPRALPKDASARQRANEFGCPGMEFQI